MTTHSFTQHEWVFTLTSDLDLADVPDEEVLSGV